MFMCALACEKRKDRFHGLKWTDYTMEGESFPGWEPISPTPTVYHFAPSLRTVNYLEDGFMRIFVLSAELPRQRSSLSDPLLGPWPLLG